MSTLPQLAAIYRSPSYSPLQHATNDTAILDATVAHFIDAGWAVHRLGEDDLVRRQTPKADVYLNMCQGRLASESLLALEAGGAQIYNRPSSVLSCHRHQLVTLLASAGIPGPATALAATDGATAPALADRLVGDRLWVKRGDVHAERAEDVVLVERGQLAAAIARFAARGVQRVAVQEHVEGVVYKFYGLADGSFFEVYRADTKEPVDGSVDRNRLRQLALQAAAAVQLDIFGGDFVIGAGADPMMIDLNDWPSFAPVRANAARAIATKVQNLISQGIAA